MVIKQTEIEQYNYSAFKGGESDFLGFRSQLQVGSSAPDFVATVLETGELAQLKYRDWPIREAPAGKMIREYLE